VKKGPGPWGMGKFLVERNTLGPLSLAH
jgi:hypothetical protein